MGDYEQSIERATDYYQAGNPNEAAKLCRGLLKKNPKDVEALHMLGVIFIDAGLYDQATGFLEQAVAIGGPNSSFLHNYGLALRGQGKLRRAAWAFYHVVNVAPLRTDSWYNLGEVELLQDRPEAAIQAFEKVLEHNPDSIDARHKLGVSLQKAGRLNEARAQLLQSVNADLKNAAAQNNLGITETELGHLAAAKIAFQSALGVAPDYADAHYNLGNVYVAENNFGTAAECYLAALSFAPDNGLAIYHLALCRQKQRAYDDALGLLNSLLERAGDTVSEKIMALGARANIYRDLGQPEAALADLDTALAEQPGDLALLFNKALTQQHAGQLGAAISTYRAALAINPEHEALRTNLAQALLLAGQFSTGWREFEARLSTPVMLAKRHELPGAAWVGAGDDLTGKHVLLWCEQGLGDTLQFMRYLPVVAATAQQVTLRCPDRLKALLQNALSDCRILGESESLPAVDFNAPLMSLPFLLGLADIPAPCPYLFAAPARIKHWEQKLGPPDKPRIGIVWQGNPVYEADHQRSLSLRLLAPLLACSQYQFVSLQQGFGEEQLADLDVDVVTLGQELDKTAAFIDSAAVMANLDLVITSDTAMPHLAGALGCPVWLMLPQTPDWRWQLNRTDSPWYPTMRLFRQTAANDWPGVIAAVMAALDQEDFRR